MGGMPVEMSDVAVRVNESPGMSFGTVVPIDIRVENLSIEMVQRSLSAKGSTPEQTSKTLLKDINMEVPHGKLMAIMGGSGSGKTTLLNALAGRTKQRQFRIGGLSKTEMSGRILFNGRSPRYYSNAVAYVQQHDALLPYLTVRQTLRFAGQLRLPRTLSRAEKDTIVESVINELGLKHCASTLVGNEWRKGISGGEKRRVSVGVQLLLNPSVIFMDEPTTGLDAFSARALIETLSALCERGRTIVVSIHQPRSDIFNAFTHITLLAQGRLAYSGSREGALSHFASLGHEIEENVNGADFLIDITNVDYRSVAAGTESKARVNSIIHAWEKMQVDQEQPPVVSPANSHERVQHHGATFFQQIRILCGRVVSNMVEDRLTLWGTVLQVVSLGLALGFIFYQLDETPTGILSRKSAMYSICALPNYLSLMFIIWKLCNEMAIFDRERSDNMYSVPAYLVSWYTVNIMLYVFTSLAYTVIVYFLIGLRKDDLAYHFFVAFCSILMMQLVTVSLGYVCASCSRDFGIASLIGNSVFTFLSMSSGFFIPVDVIPVYLRWFGEVGYITMGLRVIANNELESRVFACPGLPSGVPACQGSYVLSGYGFKPGLLVPFLVMIVLVVALAIVAGTVLHLFPNEGVRFAAKVKTSEEDVTREEPAQVSIATKVSKPVTVIIDDLSMAITRKTPFSSTSSTANILQSISATFVAGSLTAIFGVSGAGKSTVLSLLAGRKPALQAFSSVAYKGKILHNGKELAPEQIGHWTASVRQDDTHLLPALTARETLRYAAALRLPNESNEKQRSAADRVLGELGLTECADTLVGGGKIKGLSGGEKRRLSVGLAMLSDPAVLICDEPTSGLDAATARNMMSTLKQIALTGRTVICTIHQPRSDIFPLLDSILLLARGGHVVFQGSGSAMISHFATLGYQLPPLTNPADFAIDVSSIDVRGDAEAQTTERVHRLIEAWHPPPAVPSEGHDLNDDDVAASVSKVKTRPSLTALPVLVERSFRNLRRQADIIWSRLGQSLAFALILAAYLSPFGHDQASVTTRIGYMQQAGALVFIGMLNCIAVFPQERSLFRFERQDGLYSTSAFFWTYTMNELPFELFEAILWALVSTYCVGTKIDIGLEIFVSLALVNAGESIGISFCSLLSQPGFSVQIISSILSLMSVMAGFLSTQMPETLNILNHASILRYAARAQAIEEFRDEVFTCGNPLGCQFATGADVLSLLGFDSSSGAFSSALVGIAVTAVAYRISALLVMATAL
ncbi:ABC transporter domain-containing protein [Plasmodiophora brassicae]